MQIGDGARRTMEAGRSDHMTPSRSGGPQSLKFDTHVPGDAGNSGSVPCDPKTAGTSRREAPHDSVRGGHLDEAVIRGIIFARLTDLVSGLAPVRPVVADRVTALLEGPLPQVLLDGQVGPDESLPLGRVLEGLDRGDLEPTEERALLGGSPCSAALVADAALRARHRLENAEAIFALSIEAFRAPLGAYDEVLDELFSDSHETAALRSLRMYLAGVEGEGRRFHQAPVSYRITPRVLGQVHRAVAVAERAATVSLRSVTVEEIWLPPDHLYPYPRAVASAGVHNAIAYPALNGLCAAWADLALVGERQVTALNTAETSDLPLNLAVPDFPRGTYAYGWAASGYVEEARAAATPTLLPAVGSGPRDDILTPTFIAHRRERRAAECLDGALAILALVSSQALFVTGREPPAALRPLLSFIRSFFPPIVGLGERDLSGEAGQLQQALAEGAMTGVLSDVAQSTALFKELRP